MTFRMWIKEHQIESENCQKCRGKEIDKNIIAFETNTPPVLVYDRSRKH